MFMLPDCECKSKLLHIMSCPYWDGTRCSKCGLPVFDAKYEGIKVYCSDECYQKC